MTAHSAVLAALEAVPNLNVYDGFVEVDETEKIVRVTLPYVVLRSGLGRDIDERQGGKPGGTAVPFQVEYVGETPEQTREAGRRARAVLSRKRVSVSGRQSGLMHIVDTDQVRREDVYTRPGGEPLFRGVDQYEVGI